ncbi:uncharacterized protein LOC132787689 isoform X2 [Drosophila nasuta]|uniref:uncharacterized protein LOC132787689 isoform X2 n=1 Tax=Drosophila nasuta TaxID=42062 RepID=UPI00295F0C7A|nr:uncharacterized protein LOC132787689 isoform X2 [Drosophila nasuta]
MRRSNSSQGLGSICECWWTLMWMPKYYQCNGAAIIDDADLKGGSRGRSDEGEDKEEQQKADGEYTTMSSFEIRQIQRHYCKNSITTQTNS